MTNPTPYGQVPEALRLADALDRAKCIDYYNHVQRDLESAAAEVAKLRGQRMVLCSLLGECLPAIQDLAEETMHHDTEASAYSLIVRIESALNALAEDQVKGGES